MKNHNWKDEEKPMTVFYGILWFGVMIGFCFILYALFILTPDI